MSTAIALYVSTHEMEMPKWRTDEGLRGHSDGVKTEASI